MTQSYSVITKDLNYLLDLVREYREKAEETSKATACSEKTFTFYRSLGESLAYAKMEGHIEGMLSVNEICAK